MNHGVHGVQTKEGLGFAKSHKAKGILTQKVMALPVIKILYFLPSVVFESTVVKSHFPF